MSRDELAQYLERQFAGCELLTSTPDHLIWYVEADNLIATLTKLKTDSDTAFDFLSCQTAVDYATHIDVVYHLTSVKHNHSLVIKVKVPRASAELPSVYTLWKAADLYECEIHDLFGITFNGHPNLRRLFMPEGWVGYPLLKDYDYTANPTF